MGKVLRVFGDLVDYVDRLNTAVCATLIGVVVLLAGGEVIARNAFQRSSLELVDLSLQLAVLMYFIGYASLLNRNQDIRVEYFYDKLPPKAQKALDIITMISITVFFSVLLAKSIMLFRMGLHQSHPVFPIPNAVVISPAVLGAAGGLLVAVRKSIESIVGPIGSARRIACSEADSR